MAAVMPQPRSTSESVSFSFEETREALTAKDLGEYLYYLRVLYGIAIHLFPEADPHTVLVERERVHANVQEYLEKNGIDAVMRDSYASDLGDFELVISKLRKESPFEIILAGSLVALVVAAIISGGEVDFKVAKFKLKPIGDGLGKLKRLFKKG